MGQQSGNVSSEELSGNVSGVRAWLRRVFENFSHFSFCMCFNYVTQITRISLTHTTRKSLENQRSNENSHYDENSDTNARTRRCFRLSHVTIRNWIVIRCGLWSSDFTRNVKLDTDDFVMSPWRNSCSWVDDRSVFLSRSKRNCGNLRLMIERAWYVCVRAWCSSAKRENFNHFTFSVCSNYVTQITRISLSHTHKKITRKSTCKRRKLNARTFTG